MFIKFVIIKFIFSKIKIKLQKPQFRLLGINTYNYLLNSN